MERFVSARALGKGCLIALLMTSPLIGGCDYFVSPQTRYERAQTYIERGDYRSAVVELKNALQKEPALPGARLLLAEAALWLGDAASAEKELSNAAAQSESAKYADLQARIDLSLGRSRQLMERLAKGDSAIEPARQSLYRGLALQTLRQTEAAEREFRAAVQADPTLIAAQVGIAESLADRNDLSGALQASAAITKSYPESPLGWYAHGVLQARQGDTMQAAAALERARDLAPGRLEVLKQAALLAALTEVQLTNRDGEGARDSSAALSKIVPGSPIALLMSSRVSMASNDFVGAVAGLRRVVGASPQFVQGRFMLAIALLAQGNLEQASQELNRVVEQAPEHLEARQLLAQVRMRLEDPDNALRVLVPAMQAGTDDARLTTLVDAARAQSSSLRAVDLLSDALAAAPGNRNLEIQLASAYLQAGAADKALALLRSHESATPDARRAALLVQAIAKTEGTSAARAQVDAMVAADPGSIHILSLAAAFYARIGDFDAGRRVLTQALAKEREQPALLFTLAQLEWAARQPAAARAALQRLLRADPANSTGTMALAEIELRAGNVPAATSLLENLRQRDPASIESRLLLARLALAQDDVKRADTLVAESLKAAPGRAEVFNAAGMLYLTAGRYDQAAGHFRDGTQADPGNALLWLNLGRAQMALAQPGPARETFNRARALRPNWVPAEGALAFMELQSGDREGALERIAALKQARPRDADVLALDGEVQMAVRRYREAAQAFEASAEITPSGAMAARAYQARLAAKLPDAAQPLERWVQQHPEDLALRSMLAEAYTQAGARGRAVQQYEAVLARQPQHVQSLNNLAWLYYELKDPRAVDLARKASTLAPGAAAVSDTLGWILVETGRIEEGLRVLQGAASQPGANGDIRYHYAAALARAGSKAEARQHLQKALEEGSAFSSREAAERLLSQLTDSAAPG